MKAGAGRQSHPSADSELLQWHTQLIDRRQFLLTAAGGSLALLFGGLSAASDAATEIDQEQRWAIVAAVQQHLFPSEADAPGATEIRALTFLQRAMAEPDRDPEELAFLLQGAGWLQQLVAQERPTGPGFTDLDSAQREAMLQRIAASQAGENWLSTLLLFIIQALLTDPVYGGNPAGIGWAWLKHTPGFPQPEVPYYQLPYFRV